MTRSSLIDLWHDYEAGADGALDRLLTGCRAYAAALILRRLRRPDDDLVQVIVISVWQSLDQFSTRSSFTTWFHSLAERRIIDALRARYRTSDVTHLDASILEQIAPAKMEDDPERSFEGLSEEDSRILRTFSEWPDFDETAERLDLTPKALRSRLERISSRRAAIA